MKKNLKAAVFVLFLSMSLMSCVGPEGPAGPEGWANIRIYYYTVSRWSLSANRTYFFAEMNCPDLTANVLYNGTVSAYLVIDYGAVNETHVPLPYDIYYNDSDAQWTETVSFDMRQNEITFYYEPSDFYTQYAPPSCMFKVVVMW
jgi:hypothetical protein